MPLRKVIDSHFHIFDLEFRENLENKNASHEFPSPDQKEIHRTHPLKEAEEEMKSNGIMDAFFVQCYNDCPEESEWVAAQAPGHDILKGVVGGLDLTKHDKLKKFVEKARGWDKPTFLGVRHLLAFEEDDFLVQPAAQGGLAILEESGLCFDLQAYPQHLKYIAVVAAKFPKLKMVLDHLAKPNYLEENGFEKWALDITEVAKQKNVYCKLSGMINEVPDFTLETFRPYVEHCIKVFGASRCMYGSDWPVCKLAKPYHGYKQVLNLLEELTSHLSEAEQDLIFYGTAKNFYAPKCLS